MLPRAFTKIEPGSAFLPGARPEKEQAPTSRISGPPVQKVDVGLRARRVPTLNKGVFSVRLGKTVGVIVLVCHPGLRRCGLQEATTSLAYTAGSRPAWITSNTRTHTQTRAHRHAHVPSGAEGLKVPSPAQQHTPGSFPQTASSRALRLHPLLS